MTIADITLHGWMLRRCNRTPHREAMRYQGLSLTYAQVEQRILACAEQLHELGVGRGDRVAFLDLNNASFFVALFATSRLGAIFVPINFRLTASEIAYILQDSEPHALIVGHEHHGLATDALTISAAPPPALLSADDDAPQFPALRTEPAGAPIADPSTSPEEPALLMYTSGTTGRPKGATLSHENVWWNNINGFHSFDVVADDVTLLVMPIFHIGALNTLGLSTLQKGGVLVIERRFEPVDTLQCLVDHQVTTMMGVPTAFQAMADLPQFDAADLSHLRLLICGASPCPISTLNQYADRGLTMVQGWGMTEAAPVVTFLTEEFARQKVGSAGNPVLLCDVRLMDNSGRIVTEPFDKGEAQVRGPNVMLGYWRNPTATTESFTEDGWFRTGDIAYADDDGFYFIVDRAKDMIISGGENVYSAEVEAALQQHPDIVEVAVVGYPDPKWGESVAAVAALSDGTTLSIAELRTWAADRLARYKLPRKLFVVDALPRNATGKLLKYQIRQATTDGPLPEALTSAHS